ncbi:MAG: ATPase, T2SS/T4P/T4SS family [Proteobacteria bacterium]|nr:ATPase, T2SS/T4P/T4SS family [Pseudomonadota bacterium]
MATYARKKLGEILIDSGLIDEKILKVALDKSKVSGERIGEVLVKEGYLTEDKIAKALGEQYHIPYIGENILEIDKTYPALIPAETAYRLNAIPIYETSQEVTIAIVDPLNVMVIDELKKVFKKRLKIVVTTEKLMKLALEKFYATKGEHLDEILSQIDLKALELKSADDSPQRLERLAEEAPIVQIVYGLLLQAINDRASDIHIEPSSSKMKIRFRIDGILHDITDLPRPLLNPIVSRIKIMSDMDISEKRLPQDGHLQIELLMENGKYLIKTFVKRDILRLSEGSEYVDVRVSTSPTIQGEKVVLRLLRKRDELFDLEKLNIDKDMVVKVRRLLNRPYGLFLITGPTGSGKTTTAYACLKYINKKEKNVITVEDPVEYQIVGANQIQVNPKISLSFAGILRNILRQDPDILLIGEIRDKETAEIAIQSALTGHLVISTLHTNDAISTIVRLLDMGIESYLISSAINGIVSQRLLRKICPFCKREYTPPETIILEWNLPPFAKFYRGEGCSKCHETGYYDRIAIYELLLLNDNLRNLILNRTPSDKIREEAIKDGFVPLKQAGLRLVLDGITTIDEVIANTSDEVLF